MKLYVILVLVILAMTVLVDEVEAGRRRKTFKKLVRFQYFFLIFPSQINIMILKIFNVLI